METKTSESKKRSLEDTSVDAPDAKRILDAQHLMEKVTDIVDDQPPRGDYLRRKGNLWTSKEMPKPETGCVLVEYLSQSTSSYLAFPMTRYWIPVAEIGDELWQLLVACNGFYYSHDADQHESLEKDEVAQIDKAFLGTTATLWHLLQKKYILPDDCIPKMEKIAAFITTGTISD